MIGFLRETFAKTIEEAKPLLLEHWHELARNKDRYKLDPDYDAYNLLERCGRLRVYTSRNDGKLCGYASYVVGANLHYRSIIWASSDIFWLSPKHRGGRTAVRFFNFIESELRRERIDVMHTHYKLAHPAAGRILSHLGHTEIEMGCSKVLSG